MSVVEELSLSLLTTEELGTIGSSFVKIITPLQGNDFIDRIATIVSTTVGQYSQIPGTPQSNEDSSNIQGIDEELDRIIVMLEKSLKNNVEQYAFFPEKAQSSKELLKAYEICDRHDLIYGNYDNQETQINKLLNFALSEEMKVHREASGTAPIWDSLNNWNKKLRDLLLKRTKSGKLDITSKEVRQVLKYRIKCLLTFVDMNITDNITGYPEIKEDVNQLIRLYMGKVKARKTRKESEDEVSEEGTVEG